MVDPVILSGGDLGGQIVEGDGWADGEVIEIGGLTYRRQGDTAVFCGD